LFKSIKRTNLNIQDAACLYVVHILQHPTSRPSRKSTQNTMVNALKYNLAPLPAGEYGNQKSTPPDDIIKRIKRQQRLGSGTGPSHWSIAQPAIQNEACCGETMRNSFLKQRREGEMDREICGKKDLCCKNVS